MDRNPRESLREDLIEATRLGFDICRRAASGERIYAYALVLGSTGGEALLPWCHTEESFARKEARWNREASSSGYRRYNPDEWWALHGGPVPGGRGDDWWGDLRGEIAALYEERRIEQPDVVLDLLIDTLNALEREGYFGIGAAREDVTVLVYVSDDEASHRWLLESIRQVNPRAVVERCRQALRLG